MFFVLRKPTLETKPTISVIFKQEINSGEVNSLFNTFLQLDLTGEKVSQSFRINLKFKFLNRRSSFDFSSFNRRPHSPKPFQKLRNLLLRTLKLLQRWERFDHIPQHFGCVGAVQKVRITIDLDNLMKCNASHSDCFS